MPLNEIIFYETEDGKISIAVKFEHKSIWLTQKHMPDLFKCTADNISLHLKNSYLNGGLTKNSTAEESSVVQQKEKRLVARTALSYNLEAIIAIDNRVNTERGIVFRALSSDKLNALLKFNEQEVLEGVRKVSHNAAKSFADKEYEKDRVLKGSNYKFYFNKLVKNVRNLKSDQENNL